jgi:hypothetical protein
MVTALHCVGLLNLWVTGTRVFAPGGITNGAKIAANCLAHLRIYDDDDFYLFLQKQQPAHCYIPIGYEAKP